MYKHLLRENKIVIQRISSIVILYILIFVKQKYSIKTLLLSLELPNSLYVYYKNVLCKTKSKALKGL